MSLRAGTLRPPALELEEVTREGGLVADRAALRDDGEAPDARAADGFYTANVALVPGEREGERFFRLRAAGDAPLVSGSTALPITDLPLGLGSSSAASLVDVPRGRDRIFADEVTLGTRADVTPERAKALVAEVGARLGLAGIKIDGFLPRLHLYSVKLGAVQSFDGLARVMAAFEREEEVAYAAGNYLGRDAAFPLSDIHVDTMRTKGAARLAPEIYGSSSIGVAVPDTNPECGQSELNGRCVANPFQGTPPGDCAFYEGSSPATASPTHGTKVMQMIAGAQGSPSYDGVEEGVAWNATLFPFELAGTSPSDNLASSIHCAANTLAVATGAAARIINISREFSSAGALSDAICDAACADLLVVSAAGNYGCSNDTIDWYPSLLDTAPGSCDCTVYGGALLAAGITTTTIGQHMLTVGGVDASGNQGDSCSNLSDPQKSKKGEIFAPGWGIPGTYTNGTSFAAPLVSGCAAVLGAVSERRQPGSWRSRDVASRLLATTRPTGSGLPLLDCEAAVLAYDVEFVLDHSGSMGLSANDPVNPATTRWEALRNAANGFAQILATTAPAKSGFGLTLFSTTLETDPIANLVPIDASLPTAVAGALLAGPAGATAMGAGLVQGRAELATPGRPRTIVLFTDGEQNQPPEVLANGCEFGPPNGSKLYPACPAAAPKSEIRIVTIGIGQPSGAYLSTLQQLASQNNGTMLITTNGATFSDGSTTVASVGAAFDHAIAPALAGASPQVVTTYRGQLSTSATFTPFAVNQEVSRLILRISLPRRLETPNLSSLAASFRISKDGTDVTSHFTPVVSGSSGTSMLIVSKFEEANLPIAGLYEIAYTAGPRQPNDSFGIVPYADDHRLAMEWGVEPAAPRAQQPFTPTLSLRWLGQPITSAQVTAQILRPGDDLGDVLAKDPTVVDLSSAPDAGSPGTQKYFHLLANAAFAAMVAPNENALTLDHQGDGKYAKAFDPGDVSGVYQILYQVAAQDPAFGTIQRQAVQSVYTRFADIDWEASKPRVSVKGGAIQLHLRPITRYGRLIGPAQGAALSIASASHSLREITDHQDGSYTLVLAGELDDEPVAISVLGEPIYSGPIPSPRCAWIWWIVLLLLLLLAIAGAVVLLRRRSAS